MQLVRADRIFGLLHNVTVFIRWKKLRADRGVDDIFQDFGTLWKDITFDHAGNHPFDKCLRDAGIDAVHAHLIGVIGTPAKGKLGQVSGSDDDGTDFIGIVHQHLCPLACLHILISNVFDLHIMSDVRIMCDTCILDWDFLHGDAECLHEG